MVVSVHHLASDAGVEMMREGGNAVDAAVATGFALAVVHPVAGNLGGGGFLLLRTHDGKATFIDFREKAPLAATETMYQDAQGNVLPDASVIGYRSIATPGSVAGLVYAGKEIRKARPEARHGTGHQAGAAMDSNFQPKRRTSSPTMISHASLIRACCFNAMASYYTSGETFQQPELARTLERIAADPDDFYHGKMAHELVDDLKKGGALHHA